LIQHACALVSVTRIAGAKIKDELLPV
jgi:hypothetical protein